MEHLQHFGLTLDPFSNEPDLRFWFESASHLDAQRRVERGLRQQKGLTLLTGEGGMGKTLLARRILDRLEEEVFEATLLVMMPGAADATGILQRFARQLGCEEPAADRAALLGQIYEQLAIVREDGRHAVLMIDDAQVVTADVLSELGGLLNLEYEDRRLLSMLLIGSPELDGLVENDPRMMPRVDVRVRLQSLDLDNARAYLGHRMQTASCDASVLPAASLETLYKLGRGRPRMLNTLADNALFEAYLAGRKAIEPADVERAAEDLGIGPDPGETFTPLSARPAEPLSAAVPEQRSTSVVEPAAAEAMEAFDALEPEALAAPELETEDPLGVGDILAEPEAGASVPELELTPEMVSQPGPATELAVGAPPASGLEQSVDAGLEAALEDFGSAADAVSFRQADPEADALEFDVEPVAEASAVPDAAETPEASLEEGFVLAEAELTPMGGEADELDDAFVELIEE